MLKLVTALVPDLKLGDVKANTNEILSYFGREKEDSLADFILTPELSLTGYSCQDLFLQAQLQSNVLEALLRLKHECQLREDQILIVGAPIKVAGRLFNCAVVFQGDTRTNRILGVIPKTFLPNYGEFYEQRWFAGAKDALTETIELCEQIVPFGNNLVFQERGTNVKFGVEICEDLWAVTPPSNDLALQGAQLIFNLSASNELVGKAAYRRELVKSQSGRLMCAYVYASAGVGESGADTVFSGHALIAENDQILCENKRFHFGATTITAHINFTDLDGERARNTTFSEQRPSRAARYVEFQGYDAASLTAIELRRAVSQTPFVPSTEERQAEVCEEITSIQVAALKRRLLQLPKKAVVIGVSGGLDSTLALLVAVRAFRELNLPLTGIHGVTMPGLGTTQRTKGNALTLMETLGISTDTISIAAAASEHLKALGHPEGLYDVTYENVQARMRSMVLFNRANQVGGLVLGTGDLSELTLGWMTYFGDSESHYHINSGVPKTLVSTLVRWLANHAAFTSIKAALLDILYTPISPELLPTKEGELVQETEKSVGPYILHDFFLYWVVRKQLPKDLVLLYAEAAFFNRNKITEHSFTREELKQWLENFYTRFFNNQFKRNSAPDGLKVGTLSLSQRADWRMPSDMRSFF